MLQVNGYVFTKDKRILNNWVCCIGIAFVSTFILSIIVNMLISEVDVVANMFVIVVLACVCIFMFQGRKRNMNILSLKFACETSCVINQDMHKKITLNIQNPFYISKLSLLLYSRGGKWTEEYYLLSERPFSMIPNYEEGGLRVIRVLSKENAIILPAQDNTDRWINQIFSGVVIPQYPKVAYQSKDHLT